MISKKTREYKRLWQKEWRESHKQEAREQYKKQNKLYQERYPEKVKKMRAEASRSWRERNPERVKAHKKVFCALRNGTLFTEPCAHCIEPNWKVEAHHKDYSKPLEIVWLCKTHHVLADRVMHSLIKNLIER